MNIRNNISTVFIIISILTFFSCSKNSTSNNNNTIDTVFGNSYTYTVTDTLGMKHTFSDTTMLLINSIHGDTTYVVNGDGQIGPAAFISLLNTTSNNKIKFTFDALSELNQLIFYLPYYQTNLSITNGIGDSPFILSINTWPLSTSVYLANVDYFDMDFINLYLRTVNISTNITDSTEGFISGSFNISAITQSSTPIFAIGSFNHVANNHH
jgi:hypothetical protein